MGRVILFYFFSLFLQLATSNKGIIEEKMHEFFLKFVTTGDAESECILPSKSNNACFICANERKNSDILIQSKHLNISEIQSDRIYVDVEVKFKLCLGNRVYDRRCYSNYFQVYVYHGQNEPGFPRSSKKTAYKNYFLNNFSSVYNITNNTSPKAINETEKQTFSFRQNKSRGVTFVIRSRGACGAIYRMKMYYYYCEETCKNGVTFAQTISPADGSKQVLGNCSQNLRSSPNWKNSLNGSCSSNGTWFLPDTVNCYCIQGYSSGGSNCQCTPLPATGQNASAV